MRHSLGHGFEGTRLSQSGWKRGGLSLDGSPPTNINHLVLQGNTVVTALQPTLSRTAKSSMSIAQLDRKRFFLKICGSGHQETHKHGPGAVGIAQKRTAVRPRTAKNSKKEPLKPTRPVLRGIVAPTEGKRPFSLPAPSPEFHPPAAPCGIGQGPKLPGVTLRHSPQPSRLAAPRRQREAISCSRRGVSRFAIPLRTSTPSFDGLPRQSRRSLRFTHTL